MENLRKGFGGDGGSRTRVRNDCLSTSYHAYLLINREKRPMTTRRFRPLDPNLNAATGSAGDNHFLIAPAQLFSCRVVTVAVLVLVFALTRAAFAIDASIRTRCSTSVTMPPTMSVSHTTHLLARSHGHLLIAHTASLSVLGASVVCTGSLPEPPTDAASPITSAQRRDVNLESILHYLLSVLDCAGGFWMVRFQISASRS